MEKIDKSTNSKFYSNDGMDNLLFGFEHCPRQ